MSQEKPSASDEQTPPEPSPQELALAAAVAERVMAYWKGICQPAIDANKGYIRDTKGVLTTVAEIDGIRAASFTESVRKPYFEISDEQQFLEWADEKGETVWVVRESFQEAILKKRARWVNGEAVDSQTGEVIPGVTRNPGGAHTGVKPTFTAAGEEVIDKTLAQVFGKTAAALPVLGPAAAEETAEGAE